ncbi:RINT1-like protein [Tribolium castaneum]|uniref:RINT1-like protein n=1 Tax=Tribolium castaneum TaxID=7070 RepID=D6WXF6_TRICA|nr:PREDICTED: RINT1-like protein [Tribolium castaneum]EFA07987.1 RINT1-like protein [Tribolium castaneum]|eukprot:XP_968301.1 PREDICTED: RINT1-like protein [Tribolium castaneum]
MTTSESKKELVNELNKKYGKDLLNYEKCKKIYEQLQQNKSEIERQLNLNDESSSIGKVVKEAEIAAQNTDLCLERTTDVIDEIKANLVEVEDVRRDVQKRLDKLNALQTTFQYFKVIQRIEFLSDELEREFKKKDDEQCVTIFANLCEISRNLTDFQGSNLRNYLKDTLHYWHNVLKEKLAKDFDDVMKSLKWPFVSANFSLQTPSPTSILKLQIVAEYLLQIELPSETIDPRITSALLSDFPPLCLPVMLLVQPLKKRFLYHFYGARQTNRPDKPEWYFTQILTWIRDHAEFLVKWIQPVIDKLGLHHIDAKLEFIRGLVQLAVEKLNSDLPNLQFDDFTFSHSIDEALGFDKELRETYSYPPTQPSILAVLTQAKIIIKWMAMEKKYAMEKMDAMMSSATVDPFEPLTYDIEDLKITTCADAFITLLQTITERYEALPQPGHRLQFLDLQLELLDDFRIRLLQLVNAEHENIVESKIPTIANTIYYIENVLVDWGAMLHYLNLYYYKSQLNDYKAPTSPSSDSDDFDPTDIEGETVFAETLSLYRHMRRDLLFNLSDYVMLEVRSQGKAYRRERWSSMNVGKDIKGLSLTPTACPIFEIVAKRLHQLQKTLASKLFTIVWRSVAQQLDNYLFEDLVLDNRFNTGGALQLKYDVTRNLLPLFSQYTERPETYFVQLIEACNLLNITKGSALLLRETLLALEGATGIEDSRGRALKEVGVVSFTPKMAVKILNQRTDITVNRMDVD